MYIYLSSMILSQIFLQNYFENFPSPKFPLYFLFQAGPADRTGRPDPVSRTCTLVHVCRSTDRSTDLKQPALCFLSVDWPVDRSKIGCSLFLVGQLTGRPVVKNYVSSLRPVDWPVDPSPTAICQQGWRSTGPVDRQAYQLPTALSSLVKFWNLFFYPVLWQNFSEFLGLFWDQISLI